MILLLNTSHHPRALIAIINDGKLIQKMEWTTTPQQLGTELLIKIDELLTANSVGWENINLLAIHTGPGHYGAVRQGVVVATTLGLAKNLPVVGMTAVTLPEQINQAISSPPSPTLIPQY